MLETRGARRALIIAAVALTIARAASAQGRSSNDAHTVEISGGYSFLRDLKTDLDLPQGWTAGAAWRVSPVWLFAQYDEHRHDIPFVVGSADLRVRGLMAGGRMSAGLGPFREFLQVGVGSVSARGEIFGIASTASGFGVEISVGLDYPLSSRATARLLFADRVIRNDGAWSETHLRLAAALVWFIRK